MLIPRVLRIEISAIELVRTNESVLKNYEYTHRLLARSTRNTVFKYSILIADAASQKLILFLNT